MDDDPYAVSQGASAPWLFDVDARTCRYPCDHPDHSHPPVPARVPDRYEVGDLADGW